MTSLPTTSVSLCSWALILLHSSVALHKAVPHLAQLFLRNGVHPRPLAPKGRCTLPGSSDSSLLLSFRGFQESASFFFPPAYWCNLPPAPLCFQVLTCGLLVSLLLRQNVLHQPPQRLDPSFASRHVEQQDPAAASFTWREEVIQISSYPGPNKKNFSLLTSTWICHFSPSMSPFGR